MVLRWRLAAAFLGWVFLCAYSVQTLSAQASGAWPPIAAEELALQDNPASPGATALLLDRDSHVDDVNSFQTEHYRIKIFRPEGRKFADVEIPYFPQNESVRDIRARKVNPDGTASEFQGEVFDRLILKSKHLKYQARVFTIPDVQPGNIIEYSYTVNWRQHVPDVLKNPRGHFILGTYSYPTVHWTIQHELFTRHARFSIRPLPKANLRWILVRLPGMTVTKQPDGSCELEVRNVPPLEHEELRPPEPLINSRVHFFYVVGLESTFWSSVGSRWAGDIDVFIGHSKKIEQVTAQTFVSSDSPETKLRKIYARVQQIRNLSYEPAKTAKESKQEGLKDNRNAEDVLNHGYGYNNEINDLLVAMARAAGLPADIVLVADRAKSIFDTGVLDASQLNTQVVLVTAGPETFFLDPGTRFCPFGMVPWFKNGLTGLRLDAVISQLVKIPGEHGESATTKRTSTIKFNSDGSAEGQFLISFAGQEALTRRLEAYDEDDAGRKKMIEDEIRGWLPEGATVEISRIAAWDTSDGDLQVDGHFLIPQFGSAVGRRFFLPTTVFQRRRGNLFQPEKRTYPIYFAHSYQTEDKVTFQFSSDLHVAGLPKPQDESNDNGRYQTVVEVSPGGAEFKRTLVVDGFIYDPSTYPVLKRFFGAVAAGDAQQIVLEQTETGKGPLSSSFNEGPVTP